MAFGHIVPKAPRTLKQACRLTVNSGVRNSRSPADTLARVLFTMLSYGNAEGVSEEGVVV